MKSVSFGRSFGLHLSLSVTSMPTRRRLLTPATPLSRGSAFSSPPSLWVAVGVCGGGVLTPISLPRSSSSLSDSESINARRRRRRSVGGRDEMGVLAGRGGCGGVAGADGAASFIALGTSRSSSSSSSNLGWEAPRETSVASSALGAPAASISEMAAGSGGGDSSALSLSSLSSSLEKTNVGRRASGRRPRSAAGIAATASAGDAAAPAGSAVPGVTSALSPWSNAASSSFTQGFLRRERADALTSSPSDELHPSLATVPSDARSSCPPAVPRAMTPVACRLLALAALISAFAISLLFHSSNTGAFAISPFNLAIRLRFSASCAKNTASASSSVSLSETYAADLNSGAVLVGWGAREVGLLWLRRLRFLRMCCLVGIGFSAVR
ncbi:hypothetical protein BDZ88DRAFT_232230 [Geranomyces variabilis]|nr:hypothetical protein BDZ88DRAFT_232230 [Geranomyces variabilis]